MHVSSFIDDVVLIHPWESEPELRSALQDTYGNLRFGYEQVMQKSNILFMELFLISISSIRTRVYFKATNTCTYIPWVSNTPRSAKVGWVVGEIIRFLWLYSHEGNFLLASERLQGRWPFGVTPEVSGFPHPPSPGTGNLYTATHITNLSCYLCLPVCRRPIVCARGLGIQPQGIWPSRLLHLLSGHHTTALYP